MRVASAKNGFGRDSATVFIEAYNYVVKVVRQEALLRQTDKKDLMRLDHEVRQMIQAKTNCISRGSKRSSSLSSRFC